MRVTPISPSAISRRAFGKGVLAASSAGLLAGCGAAGAMGGYEQLAAALRVPLSGEATMPELIRYATLAANAHNAQPWLFVPGEGGTLAIMPDPSRRTPIVDPDDHHLYVSLGCALENLLIAAEATGQAALPHPLAAANPGVGVAFGSTGKPPGPLFWAITRRQCTRSTYSGTPVAKADLDKLLSAAAMDDIDIRLITDAGRMARVAEYVVEGNERQLDNPAFIAELKDWIRFDTKSALRTRDGLFNAVSGQPAIPAWLAKGLFPLVFRKDSENSRYREQIASSAGIAVFTAAGEDPDHWIRVGRSYQRFALMATAMNIRHAHVNQPVEVEDLRPDFAQWLGVGDARPSLVIRFGYAPALPMSLRRSVAAVTRPTRTSPSQASPA
ncbi:nitroreductase family protein [Pacificimonas sp. WHA3]|uniref:Nitroreductase family protein n=1 Tax=Pacificimonas pallii TaxID=2827236 RepID=A0ABS6SDZ4_9SPHN|nr:nitroreductase family protein [Pacificimonas pallii]MBV7256594.1 nitroreductase family protein [Pacificimonas pallii]